MKRTLLILLAAAMTLGSVSAQFTEVGGGLDFSSGYRFHKINFDGNKSGNLAMSLKGIYKINVNMLIAPSFTFFVPHVYKEPGNFMKQTITTMMFDINHHYVFNPLDKFEFYGLVGLDVILAWNKTKYSGTGAATYRENDNGLGLNLGVGSRMKLTDQFGLYGEAKYIIGHYSQFMLNAGILINIDWLIKHENTGIN
jgi:hypothetical protein